MLIKGHMTKSFRLLSAQLTPAGAAKRLSKGEFGVVVTRSQRPVALVTVEDLKLAQEHGHATLRVAANELPRAVVAGSRVEMNVLARGVEASVRKGATHGTIVLGRKGVVGVVPVEGALAFMRQHGPKYKSALKAINVMRRAQLAGGIELGSVVLAMDPGGGAAGESTAAAGLGGKIEPMPPNCIHCAKCGYLNCLAFYPREGREPQCLNKDPKVDPHQLKIAK